jgi:hypothetical protein
MNQQDVLSRLDVERQTVPDADAVLERTQSVFRRIAKLGNRNAIEYANFSGQGAKINALPACGRSSDQPADSGKVRIQSSWIDLARRLASKIEHQKILTLKQTSPRLPL